jgi:hypothetical protein
MKPLEIHATFTFPGHFEKGRWVTAMTPFLDMMQGEPYKEQEFEVTGGFYIPIFKQGAQIGEKYIPITIGILKKSELEKMMLLPEKKVPDSENKVVDSPIDLGTGGIYRIKLRDDK